MFDDVELVRQEEGNYLRNGGFEQDPSNTSTISSWTNEGNPGSYTEGGNLPTHGGTFYGVHYNPDGHNIYTRQTVTGLTNGRYTARAWVKNAGISSWQWPNHEASFLIKEFGKEGDYRSTAIPYTGVYGAWQLVKLRDIPVSNGQCTVGFYSIATGSEKGAWIMFDDVELVRQDDFVTRNTYDASGQLLATENDDEGRSEYVYARDGRIRFSQSALQRPSGRYSYSNYDEVGRVVESGEYTPGQYAVTVFENHLTETPANNSVLQPGVLESRDANGGLFPYWCSQRNQVWYDLAFDGIDSQLGTRQQQFLVGAVAKTKNDNVTSWYSYDELGRVTWVVQDIVGVGIKTLDYQYDFSGNVLHVAYQQGQTDAFYHYYTYDAAQRLVRVETSVTGTGRQLQAEYSYYLHGPLKRVQLAGDLQGVDYAYTLQGALKSINHLDARLEPGHDSPRRNGVYKDLFALNLDYFSGDYRSRSISAPVLTGSSAPTRYDGTIQGAAWRTPASADVQRVGYTYDEKSQLQNSMYGKLNIVGNAHTFVPSPSTALQEGGLTYDPNGNIQSLRRTNQLGAVTDNFSYTYKANTNQLQAVHTGSPNGATVLDYDYDEVGQLTRQRDEQGQRYFTYDVTGKTTGVYYDEAHQQRLATYAYDDRGFRVSKTVTPQGSSGPARTTYYVRDVAGNLLSTYEKSTATGPVQRTEVPLYGSTRLGVLTYLSNGSEQVDDYRYELNDHLGDARVVFHRPSTEVGTEGLEPNTPAKYAFQGADTYRYASSQAITAPYVALLDGRSSPAPALRRVVSVQKGDTLTFSAWARTTGGFGTPSVVEPPQASARVQPFVLLGAAATSGDQPPTLPDGSPARPPAGVGRWLSRLAVGLSFPLRSRQHAKATTPAALSRPACDYQAWIKYRVLDKDGNQVGSEQYAYPACGSPSTWQQLKLGVRVQQEGTVELLASSAEASSYVMFDELRVEQTGGLIVQEQHQYAYGAPLPGLSYVVGNKRYRYGYQGQFAEHDDETGFESFELRLYNSRVGKWLTTDPEGQFSSPYVGMGNNPVSGMDPDGGWSGPPGRWYNTGRFGTPAAKGLSTGMRLGVQAASSLARVSQSDALKVAKPVYVARTAENGYANGRYVGTISAYKPTFTREWAQGNWFSMVVNYDAVNTFYLAPQIFNPNPRNLDGSPATLRSRSFATFGVLSMAIAPEEQLYEIGDGIRRAKAMQLAGHKTIQAELSSGEIITIKIRNLRSYLKTSLPNDARFKKTLDSFMSGAKQETPIYVNPGGRGIPVSEINVQ